MRRYSRDSLSAAGRTIQPAPGEHEAARRQVDQVRRDGDFGDDLDAAV